uniref:Putative head-tail attachment protein n=1 Tax=viral metagenome TaxID=1070528 RepID=A0A6H1ZNH4_9ZZZZ
MASFPIADFFTTGFEISATLTVAGVPSTISVHFVNEYEQLKNINLPFESSVPLAYVKTSDVSSAVHGSTIVISGTTYYIKELQADGTGITVLTLSKDA